MFMKAMIFAAGLGSRLGAITQHKPKALVEVGGVPMLKRVILKLKDAGVSEFVVNVHHHALDIEDYLSANENFGVDIRVSDERELLLDTGGGLLHARRLLDGNEPIIVHNVDIMTDFDVAGMVAAHERSRSDATLLVAQRKTSRYLLFDDRMRLAGWTNVNTGEVRSPWTGDVEPGRLRMLAFGGVHIVDPSTVFDALSEYGGGENQVFSITPFYTDSCRRLKINGYIPEEDYNWIDIGKPESLMAAESIVAKLRQIPSEG